MTLMKPYVKILHNVLCTCIHARHYLDIQLVMVFASATNAVCILALILQHSASERTLVFEINLPQRSQIGTVSD